MHHKKRKVVRPKRERRIVGDLAFDFTYPETLNAWNVQIAALTTDNDTFSMEFTPSLPKRSAQQTAFRVTHLPTRSSACRLMVLPGNTRNVEKRLLTDSLRYLAFETHAVQLDPQDETRIKRVYLVLDNVQLRNPNMPPLFQPSIDYRYIFEQHFPGRYKGLPYFPPDPDIDVAELGVMGIDAAMVPQRGPMW